MDFKTTICRLFQSHENIFAVPTYQRAYSWEVGTDQDKQVPQFLQDLKDHPNTVPQYHLGHFLFEEDTQERNKYWIIDGQQRMTTIVIFISCIYNRLRNNDDLTCEAQKLFSDYLKSSRGIQKFNTVEYDNNYFLNVVIESRVDKIDTKSRKRIIEAKNYLQKEINKATLEDVVRWKDLIENAKITTDIVSDKAEATQIFTFQNDRGKNLSNLEKLKAYLMLQVYLLSKLLKANPSSSIGFVEKEFECIYKSLERIEIADEDQILNYHTTAFIALAGTAIEKVKNNFTKLAENDQLNWIKDFSVNLKRTFEFVITIQEKRNQQSNIPDILYLDAPTSFPLLLKLYHFYNDEKAIEKILRLVEITLFKYKYTIGNFYSNYLPNLALDFKGDMLWLNERLMHYAKFGFKDYWNFDGDFVKYLEGDNHYFSLTRYLLWKYENSLRTQVKEPPMIFMEFSNLYGNTKFENTIDHWTPQNPYGIEYEKEFNDKYLHNIGNMVLSTRSRNASDSNSLPLERSTVSTLISRQRLEPFKGDWNKERIKARQSEIVAFAKNYWNPENVK